MFGFFIYSIKSGMFVKNYPQIAFYLSKFLYVEKLQRNALAQVGTVS
jgi:hypothetical protein